MEQLRFLWRAPTDADRPDLTGATVLVETAPALPGAGDLSCEIWYEPPVADGS